jgi:hypothetical protein
VCILTRVEAGLRIPTEDGAETGHEDRDPGERHERCHEHLGEGTVVNATFASADTPASVITAKLSLVERRNGPHIRSRRTKTLLAGPTANPNALRLYDPQPTCKRL